MPLLRLALLLSVELASLHHRIGEFISIRSIHIAYQLPDQYIPRNLELFSVGRSLGNI
jgi:hypothetical protein